MDQSNKEGTLQSIERFDLGSGSDASLTIGLDDVLSATDGINALTESVNILVIRRGDGVDAVESYTVFHDSAASATIYVENAT